MKYGSLFAGIKGDRGFDDAGFSCQWAVEIDPFCQSIIRTHYPSLPLFPDIHTCERHNLSPVDVITAGFPCQDLSVAGKRHGLDGHRSSLFWEACRIAAELRPPWLVLENVPGLFSSRHGKDFAAILRGLGNLGCFQSIAWRVLDSRWFGVAQRRRRVFLVASARKGGAEEVLFEPQSCEWDSPQSTQAWPYLAGPLGGGAYGTGRRDEDDPNLAVTISSSAGHHGHSSPRGDGSDNLVAHCLSVPTSNARYDPNGEDFVVTATLNSGGNSGGFRTEPGEHLIPLSAPPHSNGSGDFAGLPKGLDSPRYRALGNAWTVQVGRWLALRILNAHDRDAACAPAAENITPPQRSPSPRKTSPARGSTPSADPS